MKKNFELSWTEIFFMLIVFIFGARGLKTMDTAVEVEHKFMNTFSQVVLPFADQIFLQLVTFSTSHPIIIFVVLLSLIFKTFKGEKS
jgi:hypothetical protein